MIDQSTERQMTTEGHAPGFANNAPGMTVPTAPLLKLRKQISERATTPPSSAKWVGQYV